MPPLKTNYTELTHRVVRESREPLPLDEITRRVSAIEPITTKNPKGTIRNAISQSRLIVNTGDGRYGWKYRVLHFVCDLHEHGLYQTAWLLGWYVTSDYIQITCPSWAAQGHQCSSA